MNRSDTLSGRREGIGRLMGLLAGGLVVMEKSTAAMEPEEQGVPVDGEQVMVPSSIESGDNAATAVIADAPRPQVGDAADMMATSSTSEANNRRITALNNAPDAFPTFIRSNYDVRDDFEEPTARRTPMLRCL